MSSSANFVDTRLHVQITPLFEHKLPVVCRKIRDLVLDEADENTVVDMVSDLMPVEPEEEDVETLWMGNESTLDRECISVCTHMDEYLTDVTHTWLAYLSQVHSDVRTLTRSMRRKVQSANSVRSRYREIDSDVVDQEWREEMRAIQACLEEGLEQIRSAAFPSVERPETLKRACESLKKRFAESYGSSSTRELLLCRRSFERQLLTLERKAASQFVRSVTHLLRDR